MLKILIIDDNPSRYENVSQILLKEYTSPDYLESTSNVRDALEKLGSIRYDLVVVDMMLPSTPWDKNPSPTGGIELLNHLLEDDSLHRPKYLIGITSASDDDPEVTSFFENSPWMLIRDRQAGEDWEERLVRLVSHAVSVQNIQDAVEYGVDLCIITALVDPEQKAVLDLPIEWAIDPTPIDENTYVRTGTLTTSRDEKLSVVLACSMRMGGIESALLSSKLIQRFRPRMLAMVGICAGMENKVGFGDAILASPVWDWTSSKWETDADGKDEILPAPHYLDIDDKVAAVFRLLQEDKSLADRIRSKWPASPATSALQLHIGPSASGPIVVADGKTLLNIKRTQNRNVIGLEMESYGVYYAARFSSAPKPVTFSIKSVCDYADPRKNDAMQRYAAYTSANILYEFIRRYAKEIINQKI